MISFYLPYLLVLVKSSAGDLIGALIWSLNLTSVELPLQLMIFQKLIIFSMKLIVPSASFMSLFVLNACNCFFRKNLKTCCNLLPFYWFWKHTDIRQFRRFHQFTFYCFKQLYKITPSGSLCNIGIRKLKFLSSFSDPIVSNGFKDVHKIK